MSVGLQEASVNFVGCGEPLGRINESYNNRGFILELLSCQHKTSEHKIIYSSLSSKLLRIEHTQEKSYWGAGTGDQKVGLPGHPEGLL